MPLSDDWSVTDLPADAVKLEIWDKEDTYALAMKAEKDALQKKMDDALTAIARERCFEDSISAEQSRDVAKYMLAWNDEKNLQCIDWAEDERAQLEEGNTYLADMICENETILKELKNIEDLMVKHKDPVKFAEDMEKEWKAEEELLASKAEEKEDEELDADAKTLKLLQARETEQQAKQFIADFYLFVVFISVFCFAFFASRVENPNLFFYGSTIKTLIEDDMYKSIVDQNTMWDYLEHSLTPKLFPTHTYNGESVPEHERGFVLRLNRLLGGVRLRQIRGNRDKCSVVIQGLENLQSCYKYIPASPNQEPVIRTRPKDLSLQKFLPPVDYPLNIYYPNGTLINPAPAIYSTSNVSNVSSEASTNTNTPEDFVVWKFKTKKEMNNPPVWRLGVLEYPGTGFVQDLPATSVSVSQKLISSLKEMGWTDWDTRAMMVDFSLYNAGTNKHAIVRIMFEINISGAVIPNLYYNTVKLFRYSTTLDYLVLVFEALLLALQLYFLNSNYQKIKRVGLVYFFSNFWMVFDLVNNIILFVVFFIRIGWLLALAEVDFSKSGENEYVDLITVAAMCTSEAKVNAFNALLMFLRIFRFMNLNPTMAIFRSTLERASSSLMAFWSMLALVMLAVAFACFVAFGRVVRGYRTLGDSIISLFRYSAGDYNFTEMAEVQPILGPIFTLGYMIVVYFMLMNMFMSILAECYATEMRTASTSGDDLMKKIRGDLYHTLELIFPYFERQRLARELEEKRLYEIKKGVIVEDYEMDALKYEFKRFILIAGVEEAMSKVKGYEDDLDPRLKSWVPRDRFVEMTDLVQSHIEEFEHRMTKKGEEVVRSIFMKVDEDGSGFIEPDEVERMAENLQIAMTEEEKVELLMIVEDECSGAMNFDEFYEWYKRFKPTVTYDEQSQQKVPA